MNKHEQDKFLLSVRRDIDKQLTFYGTVIAIAALWLNWIVDKAFDFDVVGELSSHPLGPMGNLELALGGTLVIVVLNRIAVSRQQILYSRGVRTVGVVKAVSSLEAHGMSPATVSFVADGKPKEIRVDLLARQYEVGQSVEILYDPSSPAHCQVTPTIDWTPKPAKTDAHREEPLWLKVLAETQLIFMVIIIALFAGARLLSGGFSLGKQFALPMILVSVAITAFIDAGVDRYRESIKASVKKNDRTKSNRGSVFGILAMLGSVAGFIMCAHPGTPDPANDPDAPIPVRQPTEMEQMLNDPQVKAGMKIFQEVADRKMRAQHEATTKPAIER